MEPGEEILYGTGRRTIIFLEYGDEWEVAWQQHVRHWKPVPGAHNYRSAESMNEQIDLDTAFLLTEFQQLHTPYPSNVVLKVDEFFLDPNNWRSSVSASSSSSSSNAVVDPRTGKFRHDWTRPASIATTWRDCDILQWRKDTKFPGGPKILYTIAVRYPSSDQTTKATNSRVRLVKDVPREAFQFINRPYTSDMLLPNAFRHDIRIPNELFPERWKNLKQRSSGSHGQRRRRQSPPRSTKPRGG